ncbi:hypothetical protein KC357_g8781 [Hortaea werneckii]|nr:hypothetical protein KC357_g8781 [Hortaea werneckii]
MHYSLPEMEAQMIDSKPALRTFIDELPDCRDPDPNFPVTPLTGDDAFLTAGSDGRTIKQILESSEMRKVFLDIRNDSDALYSLHNIRVQGIEDLQLMELASRDFSRKFIRGLAKCIEIDAPISSAEKRKWKKTKEDGCRLFDPAQRGSYSIFDQRPLSTEMQSYCVQDVAHMPSLRELYMGKLCDVWWENIGKETSERIKLSQSQSYVSRGRHKALGPSWRLYWKPSAKEKQSRTLLTRGRDSDGSSNAIGGHMTGEEGEGVSAILGQFGATGVSKSAARKPSQRRPHGRFSHDRDDDFGDYCSKCDSTCGYCRGDHY